MLLFLFTDSELCKVYFIKNAAFVYKVLKEFTIKMIARLLNKRITCVRAGTAIKKHTPHIQFYTKSDNCLRIREFSVKKKSTEIDNRYHYREFFVTMSFRGRP